MPAGVTVREAIKRFEDNVRSHRAPRYAENIEYTLDPFERAYGDMQMRNLRDSHIEAIFDKWAHGSGITQPANQASTLNRKRDHVRGWLNYCQRKGWTRSTADQLLIDVSKRAVIKRQPRYLSAVEVLSFLEAANNPRDRAYYAVAVNTGLRQGEIVTLRVGHVDLEQGYINIVRHKTHTTDRMPITSDLDGELRAWLTVYAQAIGRNLRREDHLLPAKSRPVGTPGESGIRAGVLTELHPDRPMHPDARMLQRTFARMGLTDTKHEGMHTIRRSVARLLYGHVLEDSGSKDHALSIVQATLGHASPHMTQRYIGVDYFKQDRDRLLAGRGFLSELLPKGDNVVRLDERRHS